MPLGLSVVPGRELTAWCDSAEEAAEIEELYGIRLVSYEENVAVYHAEGSVRELQDLVARGIANGWPQLDINYLAEVIEQRPG